jgi:hypothetical protein
MTAHAPLPTSSSARMATPTPESRVAITDAVHSFYSMVDHGRASQTAELFTEDAKLTFGPGSPQPGTVIGAAIRDAMIAREAVATAFTRHVVSNLMFNAGDPDVSVSYILTLYRSDDETRSSTPSFLADVDEVWRSTSSVWQMSERKIRPTFFRK